MHPRPWWNPKHPQPPKLRLPQPKPRHPCPKQKKASLVGSKACSVVVTRHRLQHLLRKSLVRKKTNVAKVVAHAVKDVARVVPKAVAEAVVVAEAATVQNAAKAVVNALSAAKAEAKRAMPSGATPEPANVKSATVNALKTETNVGVSAQNAAKVVARAKTATVVTAKTRRIKTTGLQTPNRVGTPVQKRKPKCAPRHVPSAWPVKSVAKTLLERTALALRAVASAAHAVKTAVVSVPPVKKSQSMHKATCH